MARTTLSIGLHVLGVFLSQTHGATEKSHNVKGAATLPVTNYQSFIEHHN